MKTEFKVAIVSERWLADKIKELSIQGFEITSISFAGMIGDISRFSILYKAIT